MSPRVSRWESMKSGTSEVLLVKVSQKVYWEEQGGFVVVVKMALESIHRGIL